MQQLVNGGHVGDITTFFVQHLQLDMQFLRNVLAKNNDEIRLIVHLFIRNIHILSQFGILFLSVD